MASKPSRLFPMSASHATRLAGLKTRRRLWLKVHLWLGLTAGLLLALVGVSGAILVFWQELDGYLNPGLHYVAVPPEGRAAYRPVAELLEAAAAVLPPEAQSSTLYYPRHTDVAFWFFYQVPKSPEGPEDTWDVFVNPYTAQVIGKRLWLDSSDIFNSPAISLVFELHYALWLGWERGSWIVGVLAILATISVLTGAIVWWPLTGKWRQALTIKRRASPERLNHDIHKTVGIYLIPILLAVLVSGVYFNFGEPFRGVVDIFSPTLPVTAVKSQPSGQALSVDAALTHVNHKYPEGRLYWFSVPHAADDSYIFTKHVDIGGIFLGRRQIVVDQYSGTIRYVADPITGGAGNVFLQWQWPLHSGQALGLTGRILVLVSGLACAGLFITGWIRWRQKQRARRVVSKHLDNLRTEEM